VRNVTEERGGLTILFYQISNRKTLFNQLEVMKVEQIYTGCLAEAAYYIESAGEVAIIDPLRESKPYIERAEKDNAQIKYVYVRVLSYQFLALIHHSNILRKETAH
jgi:hypothetical protein